MKYYRRTYRYHADGARAKSGKFTADNMLHAMFKVEDILGYKRPLDWEHAGLRMIARPHGTRVVLARVWSPDRCGVCGQEDAPQDCCLRVAA